MDTTSINLETITNDYDRDRIIAIVLGVALVFVSWRNVTLARKVAKLTAMLAAHSKTLYRVENLAQTLFDLIPDDQKGQAVVMANSQMRDYGYFLRDGVLLMNH